MRHKITITLDVESDCMDSDLLKVAIASNLADQEHDYECAEVNPDGTEEIPERAAFRIARVEWDGGCENGGGSVDAGCFEEAA